MSRNFRALLEAKWSEHEPRATVRRILADIPDAPRTIKGRWMLPPAFFVKPEHPCELESYFLRKIMQLDPDAFSVPEDAASGDSFEALAGVAKCLRDGVRTKRFTGAVRAGVEKIESETREGEEILVVDAGAGAVPLMGICAAFASSRVRCVCLEVNPRSVALAQTAVKALGLDDRISVLLHDARTYEPEQPVDLLISETMDTGLVEEPFCSIMDHLAPAVKKGGVIVPRKVQALAATVSAEAVEKAPELVHITGTPCPKVTVEWQTTGEYVPGGPIPFLQAELPGSAHRGEQKIILVSCVVDLGISRLEPYESLITMPLPVPASSRAHAQPSIARATEPGGSFHISYKPGAKMHEIWVSAS